MILLKDNFSRGEISKAMLDQWFDSLKVFQFGEVEAAIKKWCDRETRFPFIPEIRQIIVSERQSRPVLKMLPPALDDRADPKDVREITAIMKNAFAFRGGDREAAKARLDRVIERMKGGTE